MDSLAEECTPLKVQYDECFNVWFRDSFLKGREDHEEACGKLFRAYQKCLKAAMEKQKLSMPELYDDILGTKKEKKPKSNYEGLLMESRRGMATAEVRESEQDAVQYPLHVEYCGLCTMPPEYCEYGPTASKCYEWMKANLPEHYRRLVENVGAHLEELSVGEGKRQSRGGKALKKAKKKVEMKLIQVSRSQRSKRKCVTVVLGLKTFEIDLKKASKTFAQHFSCGSSVTGEDEVVIQGDIVEEVVDFIQEQWPEVDDRSIDVIGDQKR